MPALLYLDGENLHWSLSNTHGLELDPAIVLHLATRVAEIREARLYADFSRFPRHVVTKALALGIEPVHVPAHPNGHSDGKGKSTTDQRLALDCLQRVLIGPPVEAVILGAGDGDYIHLLHKLKSHQVKVVVIGVAETTSWLLKEAADVVHDYPVPRQEAVDGSAPPAAEEPCAADSQPLSGADHRVLVDALQEFGAPVPFIPLFQALRARKQSGTLPLTNRQLKQLIYEAVAAGTIVRREGDGIVTYGLAPEGAGVAA